jgi:hypothetical protein
LKITSPLPWLPTPQPSRITNNALFAIVFNVLISNYFPLPPKQAHNGILQNAAQRYYFLFSSLAQNREKSTKSAVNAIDY